jgi:hypothetical protein
MSDILSRAGVRFKSANWPAIVYFALLLLILGTAAALRWHLPRAPLLDPDSWGYLNPAVSKLTGGTFQHTFGRNFVYPAFIFVVLCLFGDYGALTLCQHLLGLLTGVWLALAWNVLSLFLAGTARTRQIARFIGLVPVAIYLFSPSPLLFEHTVRPESVFPFFLALSFLFNLLAIQAGYVVRRPGRERICLMANLFVTCVAQALKPSMGFGLIAANLPLACWLVRHGDPWSVKAPVTGIALALVALTLWLPERILARADPVSITFLPTMLFTIHANIIRQQLRDDLHNGTTAPYAPEWLAAFDRHFERVLDEAGTPEHKPWHTLGFNADDLIYRDSVFDPFFGPGHEHEVAAFCLHYYWRTWLHRPGPMLGKIANQLKLAYFPPAGDFRRLSSLRSGLRHGKARRHLLSAEYQKAWICATDPGIYPRLMLSHDAEAYVHALHGLRRARATTIELPLLNFLNALLNVLNPVLMLLALLCGAALLTRPGDRALAGAVWLLLLVNFAMYLTVAMAHTLDIDRYLQNQRICQVFGEFAILLLPWQWMLRRSEAAAVPA